MYSLPRDVFDYGCLGADGEAESIILHTARDVSSGSVFAHVNPRKGHVPQHRAEVLLRDIDRLGRGRIVRTSDNEAALLSVQSDVKR